MKTFLLSFLFLVVGIAYADNTITSKEYVDGQVATLQTQIPAKNTNTVLTNTGTAGTIGEKAIYDTTAAYGAQSDALVTAGAFNSAIQNALESEFICVEWLGDVHDNAHCLLYEVRAATQTQTLPSGYTQLEYIESTGTQYIDTGITANSSIVVDLKTLVEVIYDNNPRVVIGTRNNVNTSDNNIFQFGFWAPDYPNYIFFNRYGFGTTSGDNCNMNTWYDVHLENYNCVIKSGTEYFMHDYEFKSTMNTVGTLYLFATNDIVTGAIYRLYGKMAYCKIQKDGSLVRNFIPARRDSDGEVGMYDTVSNTFFTNSGTGEFIAGPAVSSNLYLPSGN